VAEMAGVDKIKEKIRQDAEAKANEILEKARLQAKEIVEKASVKASQRAEEIASRNAHEVNEKKRIINSIAELEMRKDVLAAKQEAIEKVFEAVLQRLNSLENSKYEQVLYNLVLASAETGEEEIILAETAKSKLSEGFLERVNSALESAGKKGSIKLSSEHRDISGGFIMKGQGTEINNSFEALLRQYRDEIEPKVAAILF